MVENYTPTVSPFRKSIVRVHVKVHVRKQLALPSTLRTGPILPSTRFSTMSQRRRRYHPRRCRRPTRRILPNTRVDHRIILNTPLLLLLVLMMMVFRQIHQTRSSSGITHITPTCSGSGSYVTSREVKLLNTRCQRIQLFRARWEGLHLKRICRLTTTRSLLSLLYW
ncbi:hypothetical protein BDN72DRAFT_285287 [Pluteus cervinus]|uniref:Uncharacterized protein n=1 Tax=Pluteus cervinus TaxID=181527 RepID=A0ACD3AFL0_9AGAR|nr:hypothetical protein BDN72DRAFT_285287 [Pluteus cervinus]